jgi:hypothetical protein
MINKWFKIGDDDFTARDISIQFSIDTANNTFGYAKIVNSGHQTIDITISVDNNQNNSNYFFNLYDKRNQMLSASDYKFNISSSQFVANGCIIRSITSDPTTNLIVMDIRSDYSSVKSLQDRRDDIIEDILNETSKNKNI